MRFTSQVFRVDSHEVASRGPFGSRLVRLLASWAGRCGEEPLGLGAGLADVALKVTRSTTAATKRGSGTPHIVRVLEAHAAKNGPVREAAASLEPF
jgi:hypothetical protein